jgi:hypothetical protein
MFLLVRYWGLARWLALTAAFTVAVSPIATQYSTHVKQYSTDFLLTCLVLWRAEATRRSPTARRLTVLCVVCGVAILISGSVAPVIVGSWVAVLFCNLRDAEGRRRIVMAGAAMAAFLAVVYVLFFRNVPGVLHRYWALSDAFLSHSSLSAFWDSLGFAVSVLTVGVVAPSGHIDVYGTPIWSAGRIFWPALALTILVLMGATALTRAAAPALSVLAAFAASFLGLIPLGTGRTDDFLYPAIILLGVLGLDQLARFATPHVARLANGRVIGIGALGLVLVGFLLASLNSTTVRHPPQYPEINVRQLASTLGQNHQPGDWVLVDPYTRYPWTLYEATNVHIKFGSEWGAGFTVVSDRPDVFVSPSEPWEEEYEPQLWAGGMADAGRLWYVGTWYLARSQDPVYQAMLSDGWRPQQEFDATGGFLVLMTGGGTSASNLLQEGILASDAGHAGVAVARYQAAIAKDPSDVIAPYDLGVLFQQQLHNPGLAVKYFTNALRVDPTYKPAIFDLAIVDSSRDPQEAISLYNKLLALNPKDANADFNLGLLLIAHNQPIQGHADLKQAIVIDPSLASRVPQGITP